MFAELLERDLQGLVRLTPPQVELLQAHYELMMRWNARLNLTSISRIEDVVKRHYCESLFLGSRLPVGNWSIADIGSGPGFPGIPIGILRPECTVTLIESHQRKAVFLKEATRGLPGFRVDAKRAGDVDGRFDWAVSRAVRYEDLRPVLLRLADRVALLTGPEEPAGELIVQWTSVQLPWGDRRYARMGFRVPRETDCST